MNKPLTPELDDAITNALFAMNTACDLLQILSENFLESRIWQDGAEGAVLSQQAAFRLLRDASDRYLSLTTVAMQLLDRARSQLNDAGA